MTETEVERLVVRLVGDSTSYVKMLTDAQKKTQDAANKVEQAAGKIEKVQKHLEGFAASASRTLSFVGITLGLKALYEQFDEADDRITEMSAIIKANGGAVDEVIPKYQAFAAEMAKVTRYSKSTVLELMKQAEQFGLTGEAAKRAAKTAITVGDFKETGPEGFMRQAANFEKTGNAAGLARILGLMGEMEEDTTKAAEAVKLLEKNWAIVVAKGEDGGAKLQRSINSIKEVGKEAGKVIASVVEPLILQVESLTNWFQKLNPAVKTILAHFVVIAALILPVTTAFTFLTSRIVALIATIALLKQAIIGNMVMQNTWSNAIQQGAQRTGAAIAQYKTQIGVMIALAAVYKIVSAAQEELSDAMEKGSKLQSKVQEMANARNKAIDTLGGHNQNVSGTESSLHAARKRLEEADTSKRHVPFFGAGYQADFEAAKRQVEEAEALYDAAKDARESFIKSQEAHRGPNKETLEGIQALNADLVKQINTLGMTETDMKIYELRLRSVGDAAAQADLDVAEYNGRMLEAAKAQKSANDSAKDLVKSLELQVKTLGMSDREAAKVKLAMEGVDDETMKRVDALYKEIEVWEAMEEALKWGGEAAEKTKDSLESLKGVLMGSSDMATLVYQYASQFGDDRASIMKSKTLQGANFSAQPDRNLIGPQVQGADATKDLEKKLDEQTTILKQIRDKDGIVFEGADLTV